MIEKFLKDEYRSQEHWNTRTGSNIYAGFMKDLRPKSRKGNPKRVALSIFDVYDSVGECRDAKPCVSTYRQSIHSFNDCNTLCADAVFSSDADHVHASVELGHVDDLAVAFHLNVVDHLAED